VEESHREHIPWLGREVRSKEKGICYAFYTHWLSVSSEDVFSLPPVHSRKRWLRQSLGCIGTFFLPAFCILFAFILHIYCVFTTMKRGGVACDTYLAMAFFDILLLFFEVWSIPRSFHIQLDLLSTISYSPGIYTFGCNMNDRSGSYVMSPVRESLNGRDEIAAASPRLAFVH